MQKKIVQLPDDDYADDYEAGLTALTDPPST